jgi:hypothetical protein
LSRPVDHSSRVEPRVCDVAAMDAMRRCDAQPPPGCGDGYLLDVGEGDQPGDRVQRRERGKPEQPARLIRDDDVHALRLADDLRTDGPVCGDGRAIEHGHFQHEARERAGILFREGPDRNHGRRLGYPSVANALNVISV